ncbi:MAG: hypothetical protein K0U13_02155 [Chlamydiae bacterium]|nr:hypothetical protein [Chlamydiota bacterium]
MHYTRLCDWEQCFSGDIWGGQKSEKSGQFWDYRALFNTTMTHRYLERSFDTVQDDL